MIIMLGMVLFFLLGYLVGIMKIKHNLLKDMKEMEISLNELAKTLTTIKQTKEN